MAKETVENLCQKAQQAISHGRNEEAQQLYRQALTLRGDNPDVHYGLATVDFLLGDLHGAAYHFKEVTRLDPLRAGAYINLGAVYNRLEQLDDAIPVLRRGIQLDMNRAEGYYNLGLVYRRKGQPEMAIQAYREAVRINPRMADAHYNIANIYLERSQFGLSIAHYRQALEIRPNWEKALRGLEQAEAGQQEVEHQAVEAAKPRSDAGIKAPQPASPTIDPNRVVDPQVHGEILRVLHRETIDSENLGRNFLEVLESELEPVIKELSAALLYPDTSFGELDNCLKKFDAAINDMRTKQEQLLNTLERVRIHGEKLIHS